MRMTADFPTARAAALTGTMAKHFGHKIPVSQGDSHAVLTFEMGVARIEARDASLHLELDGADAPAMERLREVVESHLLRFAHREDPAPLSWTPPA
ncbi:DUF2218 domain-containing protein [Paracoccus sp. Ld10]|uniref:DUF2218 domain-containing protein n=1 Tax=Paracoccus sp. Ld10 TaxID=649158 RepID=UPI00386361E2